MKKAALTTLALMMISALGCGDAPLRAVDDGGTGGNMDAGSQAVAVNFAAKVGADDFTCGDTYDNLGTNNTSLAISDFRFFVHDVELKNGDGDYVAVTLDTNDFQNGTVSLLDFEDCGEMGNANMNSSVTGTVDDGMYDAIRFKMGVPFDANHTNPATASTPLNLTSMQWSWQGGYKFIRIDSGTLQTSDWRMHLGSTGCDGDPVSGGTTSCAVPNVVEVELTDFDPATDSIVADIAALVAGAPIDVNQAMTPFGCMAVPADMDCAPLFANLGLDFGGTPGGSQSFFSVE